MIILFYQNFNYFSLIFFVVYLRYLHEPLNDQKVAPLNQTFDHSNNIDDSYAHILYVKVEIKIFSPVKRGLFPVLPKIVVHLQILHH